MWFIFDWLSWFIFGGLSWFYLHLPHDRKAVKKFQHAPSSSPHSPGRFESSFHHSYTNFKWKRRLGSQYYSPKDYWKVIGTIKKLAQVAKVSLSTLSGRFTSPHRGAFFSQRCFEMLPSCFVLLFLHLLLLLNFLFPSSSCSLKYHFEHSAIIWLSSHWRLLRNSQVVAVCVHLHQLEIPPVEILVQEVQIKFEHLQLLILIRRFWFSSSYAVPSSLRSEK